VAGGAVQWLPFPTSVLLINITRPPLRFAMFEFVSQACTPSAVPALAARPKACCRRPLPPLLLLGISVVIAIVVTACAKDVDAAAPHSVSQRLTVVLDLRLRMGTLRAARCDFPPPVCPHTASAAIRRDGAAELSHHRFAFGGQPARRRRGARSCRDKNSAARVLLQSFGLVLAPSLSWQMIALNGSVPGPGAGGVHVIFIAWQTNINCSTLSAGKSLLPTPAMPAQSKLER
jgi:hypothetical protein